MTITIGGKTLPIAWTMGAWKVMEEDFGLTLNGITKLKQEISSHEKSRIAVRLLAPMIQAGTPGMDRNAALEALGEIRPEEYGIAILGAIACIHEAMESRFSAAKEQEDYDPLLARLDAKAGDYKHSTSWRRVTAMGLIAGISITEQAQLAPGVITDCYIVRQDYDDIQHGIKRKGKEEDDFLLFGDQHNEDTEDTDERGD